MVEYLKKKKSAARRVLVLRLTSMETTFRFSCVEAGAWPREAGKTSSYPLSSTEQEAHRHRGCVVRSMKGRRRQLMFPEEGPKWLGRRETAQNQVLGDVGWRQRAGTFGTFLLSTGPASLSPRDGAGRPPARTPDIALCWLGPLRCVTSTNAGTWIKVSTALMREGVTSQPLTADCVENTRGACVRNVREPQLRVDCTRGWRMWRPGRF